MTEFVATTPGLYPLPDWAKTDLSDLKGHQKHDLISGDESDDIVAVYEDARAEVVDDQLDAGLDRIVEGQLRWDDMLAHPLTVHENVETGGIVRYYDNNNFYRDPRVVGDLTFSGDVAEELESAADRLDGEPLQAVLPGPYSLAELASDEHYGDEAEFLDAVAEFLGGEVEAFPDHETLYLLEPSLVTDAPDDDVAERVPDAVDAVADATDADVVVHTYWEAFDEKTYAHLMDADVEAIGFDFVEADREQTLYNINEYGTKDSISLGLVDGQNTLVEDPETVRERVEWVLDQVQMATFETTYLTTNTEPFYLPVNKHQEKLAVLAEAADLQTEVEA
ncbi:5-methyltetrahydropteroyltriglutamate--homocysteine methyltransferase [Halopelagius longus]|uniref:5-methyltetrahydropteroyltriglutamate--homocysteine methyltransferase n=1 Tax=Halopelagius longus TaxID=1236180 RepID=A0A1H0Z3U7_9EURY|nr:5-methyltetrahydropteroyltriglutamate--homocysteine methyltransferase [Halopelagius longus]RDI72805.1 5-methyltetrahydropteroyltriglutamate--homocysteine methyltransferase [Halopelagius longus]SDQ21801.1 5-methyltetrahydropteroyltriglutamate--homocysteine methyltransferase [Halopelagius longus]